MSVVLQRAALVVWLLVAVLAVLIVVGAVDLEDVAR